MAKKMAQLLVFFILCMLPGTVSFVLCGFGAVENSKDASWAYIGVSGIATIMNSALNPYVCFAIFAPARREIKNLLCNSKTGPDDHRGSTISTQGASIISTQGASNATLSAPQKRNAVLPMESKNGQDPDSKHVKVTETDAQP